MRNKPVEITKELVKHYGFSLLEDPERLSQLLEDKCGECRQEIFVLTFALRDLTRSGPLPEVESFTADREEICLRLHNNLGFPTQKAEWVVDAIAEILRTDVPRSQDDLGHIEARRGFLPDAIRWIPALPYTPPLRRTALRNGLLLLCILLIFLGLFFRISLSRFPVSGEHRFIFLAHLSGPNAAAGHVRLKSAQLAADQLNAIGGVRGAPLYIEGRDMPYNPNQASTVVKDLLRDKKIVALISACDDDVNRAVAELADSEELPLITAETMDPSVVMSAPDRPRLYSFCTNYGTDYQGKLLSYFLVHGLGRRGTVLLYDPFDERSREIRESFINSLKNMNGSAPLGESHYSPRNGVSKDALSIIGRAAPEVIVLANPTSDVAIAVMELRDAGFKGPILGCSYDGALQEAARASLRNSWWIVPVAQEDPQLQSFQTSYRDKYNESSWRGDLVGAVLAYDSVRWMADAVARAPGYQGEALRHALLSTRNLALVHATLTIDPRTHGPFNKAASLVYCDEARGRFQKRFQPN